jgi:hypothetical protein
MLPFPVSTGHFISRASLIGPTDNTAWIMPAYCPTEGISKIIHLTESFA